MPVTEAPVKKKIDLHFGGRFYGVLVLFGIMSLGLSSDAFLLLRTKEAGWSTEAMIAAYLCYNASYAVLSYPLGKRSDKMRKEILLGIGLLVYAVVYLGFAVLPSAWLIWPLFVLYGLYSALTDGVSKALISNVVAQNKLASAIGLFHMVTGLLTVVASVVAGWLWVHGFRCCAILFRGGAGGDRREWGFWCGSREENNKCGGKICHFQSA